jgi:hypothetical protein
LVAVVLFVGAEPVGDAVAEVGCDPSAEAGAPSDGADLVAVLVKSTVRPRFLEEVDVEVFEVFGGEVELALVDEVCGEGDCVVDVVECEGAVEDGRILGIGLVG